MQLNCKILATGFCCCLFPATAPAAALEGWCAGDNPTMQMAIEQTTLTVEVAANRVARRCGLSGRDRLGPNSGMLFVFDKPAQLTFWMRDTRIPLSVAFIDQHRRIVGISQMPHPGSETRYRAPSPARYALEAPLGWFTQSGITTGMQCKFSLPGTATPRYRGTGNEWVVPERTVTDR